jgi:hypothetical protein
MTNTYFPDYVHSDLEDGKIRLRINISSDTDREDNYAAVTKFCKLWKDDPDEHYTFLNVDFNIKHIIEDALYFARESGQKYDFSDNKSRMFLAQLQAELIEALVEVSNTIIKSTE